MSWVGVAVAVGTSVYSGVQSNKRAKAIGGSLDGAIAMARRDPKGIFGEKLDFEGIDYSPLFEQDPGFGNMAGDVIAGNRRNLPANLALTGDTNKGITAQSVDRMQTLYPEFGAAFNQQSQNTMALLRGEIPQEDEDMLTARRTEAQSLGGGGAGRQQVAADLGLSRMDAMESGARNLSNNANLMNLIDPIARHLTPQSNFVDVGQAISTASAENQFRATFMASERDAELNYAMMPDPQKAGMMNLLASREGLKAGNPQTSVLGGALVAGAGSYMGTYNNNKAFQQQQQLMGQLQQPQQTYTAAPVPQPTYATAADRTAGVPAMSGTGAFAAPTTYNPATGGAYGQQGGLWAFFNGGKKQNAYSFQ